MTCLQVTFKKSPPFMQYIQQGHSSIHPENTLQRVVCRVLFFGLRVCLSVCFNIHKIVKFLEDKPFLKQCGYFFLCLEMGLQYGKWNVDHTKWNLVGGTLSRCWHLQFRELSPEWDLEKFGDPSYQSPEGATPKAGSSQACCAACHACVCLKCVRAYKENPSQAQQPGG